MPRRLIVRMLARLDASPLPTTDPVRLDLEAELVELLAAHAETLPRIGALRASEVRVRVQPA